jgi:hypothetical protein
MLQVVIYAWLWNMKQVEENLDTNEKIFRLFNIKSGELLRLDASMGDLNNIMSSLLCSRYTEQVEKSETQFIDDCLSSISRLCRDDA